MDTITLDEYRALTVQRGRSKWNNRKCMIGGHLFDSQAEARRYVWLRDEQEQGRISGLEVHPTFELQEGFRDNRGKKIQAIHYEADFTYTQEGRVIVEDVKGQPTADFLIKAKLFRRKFQEVQFDIIPARET